MTLDIKRILVPLDFSTSSRRALDYANGLAMKFNASVHLVHVCEAPGLGSAALDAYAITYTDWAQRLGEEAGRELQSIATSVTDLTVTTEVLFGSAPKAIVTAAEANRADLIVMGTHGHGAVMHLVMGNVAERVVRSATCPVLTVREPSEREVKKVAASKLAVAAAVLVAAILSAPATAAAQEPATMKQTTPGGDVFRTYCAVCHGTSARGDGPLSSSMNRKPANLTEIAKRNGGVFPSDLVFRTIDGRQPVRGHGGPDMPVWGDAFMRSREAGDADSVKQVIQTLVAYLESLQLRSSHDQ